jgi:DNA polymerase-3 subunit gamma/tau
MNLYLKYRPKSFDEIVGNEDVVNYFEEIFENKKSIPSTLLFHGATGCGKTTIARILAASLDCHEEDFKEINSANFRGIESVRELINSSRYHTIGGGSRIWLIDEVHQMTRDAQNAMLKILEEPPEKNYFILCTTDPNKLLPTIRGRCVTFQMNVLNEDEMFSLLRRIVKAEGQKLVKNVYTQIIEDAQGHPRNAIQILEKVLNADDDKRLEMARQSAEAQSQSIELCRELMKGGNWKKISAILKGLQKEEPETVRRVVLGYAKSVLLNGPNDKAAQIIEEFWEPLFNIGLPGLVYYCYVVTKG